MTSLHFTSPWWWLRLSKEASSSSLIFNLHWGKHDDTSMSLVTIYHLPCALRVAGLVQSVCVSVHYFLYSQRNSDIGCVLDDIKKADLIV